MINDLQNQTQASNREISDTLGLGYRTLLRWRKRVSGGEPPLTPPGPKKTGPLPLEEVRKEIEALRHGTKRSQGTCALQARYDQSISRRTVADMVAEVRTRKVRERRQVSKHVTWKEPNLAWAIDGTERGKDEQGERLHVHAVQDLCTHYRHEPLVAIESKGEAVAQHLEKLFQKYGPPLFLKRDNGSSLNHEAVDRVLADYGVIPLNSPAYYPKYNGAVEKGIREMKERPSEQMPAAGHQMAARRDPTLHPRRPPCPQLPASPQPPGPHSLRGLPPPAAAPLQAAPTARHFWVDTHPRKRQHTTTGED